MAGRPRGPDEQQQRIAVAIVADFLHKLEVPGSFPFYPYALAAAAIESCLLRFERQAEGFPVHIRQHQNFLRLHILHNGGNQIRLLKKFIEIHDIPPCKMEKFLEWAKAEWQRPAP